MFAYMRVNLVDLLVKRHDLLCPMEEIFTYSGRLLRKPASVGLIRLLRCKSSGSAPVAQHVAP